MHKWTLMLVLAGAMLVLPTALADDDDDHDDDARDHDDGHEAGDNGRGRHHGEHDDDDGDDAGKHSVGTTCEIEIEDDDGSRDVEVEFESHGLTDAQAREALAACTGQADGLLMAIGVAAAGTTVALAPLIGRLF